MRSCDVFHYFSRITKPPKNKFVVCVCPAELLFFFINSHLPIAREAGVEISPEELPCLSRVSYVDTSRVFRVYPEEFNEESHRGQIQLPLRRRIVACAKAHGILAEAHLRLLETNFLG